MILLHCEEESERAEERRQKKKFPVAPRAVAARAAAARGATGNFHMVKFIMF